MPTGGRKGDHKAVVLIALIGIVAIASFALIIISLKAA